MADESTPQTTAPAQSQPAPSDGQAIMAPQAAALTAAAVAANPGIGDELAEAAAAHMASIREPFGRDKEPEAPAAEQVPTAQAEASGEASPAEGEKPAEAAEAEKKEPEKAVEEDPVAANVAKYIRQRRAAEKAEREAREAAKSAQAEREAAAKERAEAEKQRLASLEISELAKSNPVAAIRKLIGDKTLTDTTAIMDLINAINAGEAIPAQEMTEDQRIALAAQKAAEEVQAKLKADAEAEAARAAERLKVENQAKRDAYFTGLAEQFTTNRDQYPYIDAKGFSTKDADEWIQEQYDQTRRVPSGKDVLDHFEEVARGEAERLIAAHQKRSAQAAPAAQPQPVAPAAAATRSPAAVAPATGDSRGRVAPTNSKDDYRTRRDKLLESL